MKGKLFTTILLFTIISNVNATDPDRDYNMTPDSLGIEYEQLTIHTPDNYALNAWKLLPQTEDKDTTIILAYGDSGNMSYFLQQSQILANMGFTMLLFDYRGFGKSSDFEIDRDFLYYNEFGNDLATVIDYVENNFETEKKGVWALSMGTVAATLALQEISSDFLIAEGYVSDAHLIQERLQDETTNIILPENSDLLKKMISLIDVPMLIFAGNEDMVTTVSDAESIAMQSENREIVTFDGNHLQGMWVMTESQFGDLYFQKMVDFINNQGS